MFLNEGFAAYIEYVGATVAAPSLGWAPERLFAMYTARGALSLDQLPKSTHPVHASVERTQRSIDIDDLFDGITYDKGASLVRMLRAHMSGGRSVGRPASSPASSLAPGAPGALQRDAHALLDGDAFVLGLRSYLAVYAYGNANSSEFWGYLTQATNGGGTGRGGGEGEGGLDVARAMRRWIERPHFPRLNVTALPSPSAPLERGMQVRIFREGLGIGSHRSNRHLTLPPSFSPSLSLSLPHSFSPSPSPSPSPDDAAGVPLGRPQGVRG